MKEIFRLTLPIDLDLLADLLKTLQKTLEKHGHTQIRFHGEEQNGVGYVVFSNRTASE